MPLNNLPKNHRKPEVCNEHDIQTAYFDWVRMARLSPDNDWAWLIFAIPNGAKLPYKKDEKTGRRISPQALRLLNEGLTPGVADVFVSVPAIRTQEGVFQLDGSPTRYVCPGLYLEFKRPDSGQVRKEQKEFGLRVEKRGYLYRVVRDTNDAIEMTINYLKGKEI